jgi:hypothetical protein
MMIAVVVVSGCIGQSSENTNSATSKNTSKFSNVIEQGGLEITLDRYGLYTYQESSGSEIKVVRVDITIKNKLDKEKSFYIWNNALASSSDKYNMLYVIDGNREVYVGDATSYGTEISAGSLSNLSVIYQAPAENKGQFTINVGGFMNEDYSKTNFEFGPVYGIGEY